MLFRFIEQRPGAFEHAKPIRMWRKSWPPVYEQMLELLLERWPDGRGIQEFVRILTLHRDHPQKSVEAAVKAAIGYGSVHADGVILCLRQIEAPEEPIAPLTLKRAATWASVGAQPVELATYDQLLAQPS